MALLSPISEAFIPAWTHAVTAAPRRAVSRHPSPLPSCHLITSMVQGSTHMHHRVTPHMPTSWRPFASSSLTLELPRRWTVGRTQRATLAAGGGDSTESVKAAAMAAIESAQSALDREEARAEEVGGGEEAQGAVTAARAAARAAMESLRSSGGVRFGDGGGVDEQGVFASRQAIVSPARAAVEAALAAVAGDEAEANSTPSATAANEAISMVQAALDRRDSAFADLGAVPVDEVRQTGDGSSDDIGDDVREISDGVGDEVEEVHGAWVGDGGEFGEEEPTKEPASAVRTRNSPAGAHGPLAHLLWRQVAGPGDTVLDCTAGNGHDSLELAKIVALKDGVGKLYCIDIQDQALESTRQKLQSELGEVAMKRVDLRKGNFRDMPAGLEPMSLQLVVYNLGWLPGGDKSITTELDDTLESVEKAKPLINSGGMISVMCYRGHNEGLRETEALMDYARGMNHYHWRVFVHERMNRPGSPVLLTLYRL